MASHRNEDGYSITMQNYFHDLNQHFKKNIEPVTGASFCEARQKLDWKAFEFLLSQARLDKQKGYAHHSFRGHTLRAVDTTCLTTPKSEDILKYFKQKKNNQGELGHYPIAMMLTANDVYSGQPVAARVCSYMQGSERDLLISVLDEFKAGDIALLDRGFWGFRVFFEFQKRTQFFICRMVTTGKHCPYYVRRFLDSGKKSEVIEVSSKDKKERMKLRLMQSGVDNEDKPVVLVTNMIWEDRYSEKELVSLYKLRWSAETMYNRIKNLYKIEKFHSKTYNGVMQEIFAHLLIMSLVTVIIVGATRKLELDITKKVPSFKNAVAVVRRNLFYLIENPKTKSETINITKRMIKEATRIIWKKQPGRLYPRVSRQPINRWGYAKLKKIKEFNEKFLT